MFESLESRQLMSATFEIQVTAPPPVQPTIMAVGETPEQLAKASATNTLGRTIGSVGDRLKIEGYLRGEPTLPRPQ